MSSVEVKQAPTWVLYPRAIERGRNWVIRRSITDRLVASEEAQYHTCDPESSDEVSESQMMKVTISLKSGQAKFSGPTEQEDTARCLNLQGKEGLSTWPPLCWLLVPKDSRQAWKGRHWESWKGLSPRNGKVQSGARRWVGLAL